MRDLNGVKEPCASCGVAYLQKHKENCVGGNHLLQSLTGKVHQIGAGGIGFWMAVALARQHIDLTVYDYDNLVGGLGWSRLPRPSNPEIKKVTFLRGFCLAVMGDQAPKIVEGRFNGAGIVNAGDLVVDCSDMDLEVRRGIWTTCREAGARVLRVSYDGRNNTVVVAEGLPLVGRSGGGYAEAPDLALSFAAGGIGALVVQRILDGYAEHVEFQITLEDYFKSPDVEFMKAVEAATGEDPGFVAFCQEESEL